MESGHDWESIIKRIERLLRLKSFPIAFKLLEDAKDFEKIPFLRRSSKKLTLCQMMNLVRNFDWTIGADADDFMNPTCPSILGFSDVPETCRDGTFRSIVWQATKEDARRAEHAIPRVSKGRFNAVVMAPLVYNPFEPDLVLIYANPAQIMLLINAVQFKDYQPMTFHCVGESSCADSIVRSFQDKKPYVGIPCYGERRYGHAQDDELVMAIPAGIMTKVLTGLEALYRRGVRYPISFAGAEGDLYEHFPMPYKTLDQMMARVKGNGQYHLMGVTGGIASGKTTVADLLQELGAPIIDFDLIARQVVEPGTPGFDKIINYFGRQVLGPDGTIDRKALSKIVFNDMEKRKQLESITHPAIFEVFFNQLSTISRDKPGTVIQAVMPLLIELNLQYLFDSLLVVHVSPEIQIQRLAQRDTITEAEAAIILKSQIPIDEKIQFADYVVDNSDDMNATRRQVEEIWAKLNKVQKKNG